MNRMNIFQFLSLLSFFFIAVSAYGQSELITVDGQSVNLTDISVTAEPTNLLLDDSNCTYVPGEITNYMNCMVANNPMPGVDYHLQLSKGDDYLNGVSTIDQVLIMRHIARVDAFDDPHKIVAADVNADNKVNVRDVIELRRLILGIDTEYANSDSWRFFKSPGLYVAGIGPETSLNFGGQDQFPLSGVTNITAVKIGDVNNSAIP